jgi:hypothetical protein
MLYISLLIIWFEDVMVRKSWYVKKPAIFFRTSKKPKNCYGDPSPVMVCFVRHERRLCTSCCVASVRPCSPTIQSPAQTQHQILVVRCRPAVSGVLLEPDRPTLAR